MFSPMQFGLLRIFSCAVFLTHAVLSHGLGGGVNETEWENRHGILKFGDDCSWELEKARQNATNLLLAINQDQMNSFGNDSEIIKWGDKLCSSVELLVCDEISQKCVCGDPNYDAFREVNSSMYVLEGEGDCRWKPDTYCYPPEAVLNNNGFPQSSNSKCKSGTSCTLSNGKACSLDAIRELPKVIALAEGVSPLKFLDALIQESFSGELCSCKSNNPDSESEMLYLYAIAILFSCNFGFLYMNQETANEEEQTRLEQERRRIFTR